jgi:hypothetical protein
MSLASRSTLGLSLLPFALGACGLFGGAEDHDSKQQALTYGPGVYVITNDNPTCASLGFGGFELKIENDYNKTYALNAYGDTITVTSSDGKHFDWTSTIGIDAVISKGGDNATLYVFDPESNAGNGLYSPDNGGGNVPDLSHIDFCFDYEVRVTKTATPSFDRKYTWQIDKNAESTSLVLSEGQTYSMEYTVDVSASSADSGHAISGSITVFNPAPVAATVTGVSDSFDGAPISVTCPVALPTSLASGASLVCTYSQALGGAINGTNTATATTTGEVGGGTGTAPVTFGAPTSVTDECITIDDNRYGSLGGVCADASPFTKKLGYTLPIGPYDACGPQTYENTASFVTTDTGATGSDSVTVSSNVTCDPNSCTLTQGYWKTHSAYGPAPYDATWALLPGAENTPFFLSGTTWYGVYAVRPRDGAYWQLAHQYVAAKLNSLNGTSLASVQASFDAATALFSAKTPAEVGKNGPAANQAKALASALEAFNSGAVGPGHCSE